MYVLHIFIRRGLTNVSTPHLYWLVTGCWLFLVVTGVESRLFPCLGLNFKVDFGVFKWDFRILYPGCPRPGKIREHREFCGKKFPAGKNQGIWKNG